MNMQALMQQAQKMQKEMQKKQAELEAQTFDVTSAGGAIKIKIKGSRQIESIEIDKDAIDPEEKEMLEDMIKVAINEAISVVDQAFDQLNASLTNGMRMPF
ncbi:MAG: YbaB/EbfC family nucleoid-associated protein [Bacilli bacterium]